MSNRVKEPLPSQLPSNTKSRVVVGAGGCRVSPEAPNSIAKAHSQGSASGFPLEQWIRTEGKDSNGLRRSMPRVRFSFLGQQLVCKGKAF